MKVIAIYITRVHAILTVSGDMTDELLEDIGVLLTDAKDLLDIFLQKLEVKNALAFNSGSSFSSAFGKKL